MQEDRRLAVLRAIVEDYVSTEEPVGSKALVERHGLGVSPATVRNDMAALEEEGFITQPHTSAGRVPTDKGYRLFVDRLTTVKPMSAGRAAGDRHASSTARVDLDDVVQPLGAAARAADPPGRGRAVPHALALHRPPRRARRARPRAGCWSCSSSAPAGSSSALVELAAPLDRRRRSPTCAAWSTGPPPGEVIADGASPALRAGGARRSTATPPRRSSTSLVEAMSDHRSDERVAVGGTANLARYGDSFDSAVRPLLEALEEHVVLLKLLGEASTGGAVTVRIGHEGPYQELASTSVVATGYGPRDEALATLGIVGPTRMDYPGTMAAVRAVARYVSRILDEA